ncbi:MAG TPA: ParB/RepB/Spo0J family partition protein [Steroidobacteraceae bacterium]|nr:ParB/RepB/Spo0J family partition protein [Steroidobacteraceae bacterium]
MNQKKPTLGRGLADLLGQARPAAPAAGAGQAPPGSGAGAGAGAGRAVPAPGEQLARVPVDLLQRGQYQPRSDMRTETLSELADSIRSQGIVQPIVVRPVGVAQAGGQQRYEIIAGERRWRAAQMAGLQEVPVVIRQIPDEAAIAMALIENIQREDLNPLEEARALERLIAEFGLTHQQAAEAVGRSRAAVSNLLRLLELAAEVSERLERREIEMGHARALLSLTGKRQQIEVAAIVAHKGLSVRETEALVRRLLEPKAAGPAAAAGKGGLDPNIRRLQDDLAERLGATVKLEHGAQGKGRLIVTYNSLDELDGILNHIQ